MMSGTARIVSTGGARGPVGFRQPNPGHTAPSAAAVAYRMPWNRRYPPVAVPRTTPAPVIGERRKYPHVSTVPEGRRYGADSSVRYRQGQKS